MKAINSDLGC